MTAGSWSSPARIFDGSPGNSCCSPKISIDTNSSVGRIVARRLTRNSSIWLPTRSGSHLQPGHAQQAIGHVAHAGELGVVGPEPVAMEQVNDRALLEHARGNLLVHLLARGRVAEHA